MNSTTSPLFGSSSMEVRFKVALLIYCSIFALSWYTRGSHPLKDVEVSRAMVYAVHIRDCVPHFRLLLEQKNLRKGDSGDPATALIPLASYNYGNYTVVTTQAMGMLGRKMYCRYFDVSYREIEPAVESFVFPEYGVHCCSRDGAKLMSVTEKLNDSVIEYVPILNRRQKHPKYFLSLCLSPLYGSERKWLLLAELIEHNKLQGVEHFYLYVKDMDDYTQKLITHYIEKGFVEVVPFRKHDDRLGKLWQPAFVEDCLQRSRRHSKYVIFQDLDERILLMDNSTIKEFVRRTMERNRTLAMLCFPSLEFMVTLNPPMEYRGNKTLDNYLPTLVYRKNKFTGKEPNCVIDPNKVLVMFIHTVVVFFSGYGGRRLTPTEAIMRHYSNIGMQGNPDLVLLNDTAFPEKLMSLLYSNVESTLNQVYANNTN